MWFLNILCNKIGQSPSAEYQSTIVASRKKILMQLFKLQVKLAMIFMEYYFLLGRMIDRYII